MKSSKLKWIILAIVLIGGAFALKGSGLVTYIKHYFYPPPKSKITASRPGHGDTNVAPNTFVAADILIVKGGRGLNRKSLGDDSVKLIRVNDNQQVKAYVNTSGAGDAIVLQPLESLDPGTQYRFEVNGNVRDLKDGPFEEYKATFTTSTSLKLESFPASFEKQNAGAEEHTYIGLTIGPDRKLYAGLVDGWIIRWDIQPDGTLTNMQKIHTLIKNFDPATQRGIPRLVIGLKFDPASTRDNLILWVTHGSLVGNELVDQPDWGSKLTKLWGKDLENDQDVLINLPRATKDHVTNQLDFGPDGALYFSQGSNSAMGAADPIWGNRPEHLLNAAMLKLDLKKLPAQLPLDVKTEEGGSYDPFKPEAPLTIWATGIREAFDTLWHSNGKLYTGINGSAAHGNAPSTPSGNLNIANRIDAAKNGPYTGPEVKGIDDVNQTQMDFVTQVKEGVYYGHPNPTRGEFVMFGGNPTDKTDLQEIPFYPLGTQPDRNWTCPDFILGRNLSPNGLIEYKRDGHPLNGKILIVRYSGGKDIVAITVDAQGNLTEYITGITGMNQFHDPLDLVQDESNGNLYVTEFAGKKITLLRPIKDGTSNKVIRQTIDPKTREAIR